MEKYMTKIYDGKVTGKLGTEKNPAKLTVQTDARKAECEAICRENKWAFEITLDADAPEDISALDILRNPILPTKVAPKTGRNDPCPCGSNKKFKKCCANK
ncbi:MAG: SEC-C domain-containing protein [Deltaproteobacteria bacterium]|nr:SEC-C domain-containing protein [Deltaproteobacteria bacterium]